MVDNRLLKELHRLDLSIYTAVARSPTPSLDSGLRQLSHAADYSRLSFTAAAALALFAGPRGRRAAARGVASIAVTSAVMNAFIKPVARRRRPDRPAAEVPEARHVKMPKSPSFPSGHSGAAFASAPSAVGPWPGRRTWQSTDWLRPARNGDEGGYETGNRSREGGVNHV